MIAYDCSNINFILLILAKILYYVKILIPLLLIVLIIFDLVKIVTSGSANDEKFKKETTSKIIKRLAYAIIIFLVPTIIDFLFVALDKYITKDGEATSWISCWVAVNK